MLGMSGGYQQSCGESSEEELSVLPRHTKVVVTGNNRTKSVLVGLHGVVKKAVGLGGWHWLVLTNGIEVKLQRNALSVIEAPIGHEEDDETECDNMPWNGSDMASDDMKSQKPHKSRGRHHKGSFNKSLSRSHSCDSHSKGSVSSSRGTTVDASPNPSKEQLIDAVQRHFMSQIDFGFSKPNCLLCIPKQLDELQVITGFAQAAKRLKSVQMIQ
ncbi:hypothetical protein MUK42_27174 [Musa troglodytarum]|uniref:Histone deacetylase complex subunit SAP30 Sin3 binding domain-containing protein n=1 Tax=Musa troglodytarum TaxID=320322 RepID=A0A9E7JSS3_9LILI|nr:hypothetical protein MUK42_27174 [Musa troglodytarum]